MLIPALESFGYEVAIKQAVKKYTAKLAWGVGEWVASVIAWNEFENATGISEDDVENYIFSWGDVIKDDYQYISK